MAETPYEHMIVPLKFEGVIVGRVVFGDAGRCVAELNNLETQIYLKELLAMQLVDSFSLKVEYPKTVNPELVRRKDHLRLLKEN